MKDKVKEYLNNLIIQKFPDYDPKYRLWQPGDIFCLENNAKVIVLDTTFKGCKVLAIRAGFGLQKGKILNINLNEMPKVLNSEYKKIKPKLLNKVEQDWKLGDVVKYKGNTIVLYEETKTIKGFYAMVIIPNKEYGKIFSKGNRFVIMKGFLD